MNLKRFFAFLALLLASTCLSEEEWSEPHFRLGEYTTNLEQLPYAPKDLVFPSTHAVKTACKAMLVSVSTELKHFTQLSSEKDYDSAYQVWSNLLFRFFSLQLEIQQTITLSTNDSVRECAKNELIGITENVQKMLSSSTLHSTFIFNALDAQKLSPQQRQITAAVLRELEQGDSLAVLAQYPQAFYSQQMGLAKPLKSEALTKLKVFTANIVCFPGSLPYLYGGVRPWKMRIDPLVEIILKADAEVVCLQEVWDPEAMQTLIDKLKDAYAFFIYNAGDPAGTLQVSKAGYNSGLFIASKLPLERCDFLRFPRSIPQGSNRGILTATLRAGNRDVTIFNTHLQHGATIEHTSIRKEQLLFCYDNLRTSTSMGILVGDLNINAFLPECSESGLSHLFSIPYIANLDNGVEKATCSNYLSDLVATPLDQRNEIRPTYELLDYCIMPRGSYSKNPEQILIPLAFTDRPADSLSDHHALLTIWPLDQ